ncbi:MAG: HAMP domain-containing sensor histidine kinase [Kofleriaceae bacterium]
MRRPWTLRSILISVMALVTTLSLLVAIALVVLTRTGERAVDSLGTSVEGVRLAEEAQIDLLMHTRVRRSALGAEIEGDLRRRLVSAAEHLSGPEETRLLATATASVDAYLEGARDRTLEPARIEKLHEKAYDGLEALAAVNVAQARTSQQDATDGRRLGNTLGISVGVLLVCVVGAVIVWLRRRAFRPLFGLADAMTRFGRGERTARAEVAGPAELSEMSRRFNQLADALEAQRQSQIALLGGVAHDLRGPLGALQLSIEMIGADVPASQHRLVETASRQIARLERLVEDFLNLSRLDAGELALDLRVEDARSLVTDAIELLTDAATRPRLAITLPDQPIRVRCDALRIEQVVSNLISNALKYSPARSPVEVELVTINRLAVLRVVDRGVGMAAADQLALFQPFRRVGRSKDAAPGVGLGLWVARRIVLAHGGEIQVTSTPDLGSTFTVQLPLFEGVAAEAPVTKRTGQPAVH